MDLRSCFLFISIKDTRRKSSNDADVERLFYFYSSQDKPILVDELIVCLDLLETCDSFGRLFCVMDVQEQSRAK